MAVNSPEARDASNRSFSGPPPIGVGTGTSDTVNVPSADQLKALLQLKESSPDEFLRLVESARGAASSVMENSTRTDGDGPSMDTSSSSDTSSMAREVDRQLEESTPESEDGNSGSVSIAGSSIDTILETSEWQTRKSKRPRHKSSSNSKSEASASGKASNECKKKCKAVR